MSSCEKVLYDYFFHFLSTLYIYYVCLCTGKEESRKKSSMEASYSSQWTDNKTNGLEY